MRILVVEDDAVLADGLKVGLGLHGATIDVVSTCADGQAALAVDAFDAVVLDVMLPDGSGLELLASLRAKGVRIPVLLLTALDEVSDRIRGLDVGADDYLSKPFDLDELAARIRAIGRRQEGRATSCLSHDGVTLDLARLTATIGGGGGQPIAPGIRHPIRSHASPRSRSVQERSGGTPLWLAGRHRKQYG